MLLGLLVAFAQVTVVGYQPGLGMAMFATALVLSASAVYRNPLAPRNWLIAVVACCLLVEAANLTTITLAVVVIALLLLTWSDSLADSDWRKLGQVVFGLFAAPFTRIPVLVRAAEFEFGRASRGRQWGPGFRTWLVPACLAAVFLLLFLPSNPWLSVSATFLASLNWLEVFHWSLLPKILLPTVTIWPWLSLSAKTAGQQSPVSAFGVRWLATSNSQQAVTILWLFNAVFAVQTISDLANLWPPVMLDWDLSGQLPDGKSYAQYAREGAFSLLLAAGLAAATILALLREDAGRVMGTVRALIYCWIGQILLLIGSATLRLAMYVDAYGLTRLRLLAFIGFAIIAAGLFYTIWRILTDKPNAWLVRMNLVTLAIALFACGAIDLDRYIANHNVMQSVSATGLGQVSSTTGTSANSGASVTARRSGGRVDGGYLCWLGTSALPAIDLLLEKRGGRANPVLLQCRRNLVEQLISRQSKWQSWNWRDARILSRAMQQNRRPNDENHIGGR